MNLNNTKGVYGGEKMFEVKTGDEFLKTFFEELKIKKDLNKDVVNTLVDLFNDNKLTAKNISERLHQSRAAIDENKDN